jgi:PAS domain S-box-containing protein
MSMNTDTSSFELIFEYSPIPLWEMDLTELFEYFESLEKDGIKDLDSYLDTKYREYIKCASFFKINLINRAVLTLFEVDNKQEFIENINYFFTENTSKVFRKKLIKLYKGENTFSVDTEILSKKGKLKYIRLKINIHKTDRKFIAILSTEDISELKLQEKQFELAISSSPDMITINRADNGTFSYVNETFIKKSGYTKDEVANKSVFELGMWVNEKDRDIYFAKLKKDGFVQDMPTSLRNKNGNIFEVLLSSKPIIYNEEPHLIATTKDVTKLNRLAQALKESEEQFRKAFMNIPDAVHINRISDAVFVDFNDYFLRYIGYSREDLLGKTPDELNIWVNNENSKTFYNRIKAEGFINDFEISFRKKDGSLINSLISSNIIEFNGEPHLINVTRDISKFKTAQAELQRSSEQFRLAFNTNPDPVHILDLESETFVDVNDSFLEYTGYSKEELIGKKPDDLNFWSSPVSKLKALHLTQKLGKIDNFQVKFRMKGGKIIVGLVSSRAIILDGKKQFLSVIKDITQINQAQEDLASSEEKFQNIFSKSPDALAIMEMENLTYIDVNEMFTQMSGLSYNEIIGKTTTQLNFWSNNPDRDYYATKLQNKEEIVNQESLFNLKDGTQVHVLISSKLIKISGKEHYMLIAKNIEDFVKLQKSLFEKDNSYKIIVSNSYEGIAIINHKFHFDYTNKQFELITGYTSDELFGLDFREILTEESAVIVGERYVARQAGEDVPQNYTFDIIRKSGEIRKAEIHSSVIKTAEGKPQTIAQLLDVTDRENSARIIEKENKRAKQYFEVAGMMMIALDTKGNITAINKKGCEILEESEENIVGKNWFTNFRPNMNNQHYDRFVKSMADAKFHDDYFENTIKTSSGKEINIAWRNSLLKDENNNIIGTISSGEDISAKEEVSRILHMSGLVAVLWKNEKDSPIEFISENSEILFGYQPQEIYLKKVNYHQLIYPDDVERLRKETSEFDTKKRSHITHQPYRIITKTGETKWINDRTTAQYDSDGNISYYYGVLSDITEDVLKGEKLRQSSEILSQMNDGVIITDFTGMISDWSGGAEKIFGYDNEEMLGENIQFIWNAEIEAKQQLANILSDINIYGFYQKEVPCIGKHNSKIPTELSAKILYDSSDMPLSLILVIRDITNRKIAQKALEDSENSYRHIFESILDGVIIYNMNKEIVQVNKMTTQMYGFTYDEFIQNSTSRFIHPVQNHDFDDVLKHLDNNYTKMFEGESIDITKSGDKFFVNAKGRLIFYNNEPHLLIIVRDITSLKQAEHDLFRAKEKAIESEQLKSAFLANMSHEIRTPMNSIIGFSDLMDDEDVSADEKKHFLRIIKQNGNQLLSLINDIIDISKIEAGHVQLNYEYINLYETLQDIYNMFEIAIKDKGLTMIQKRPTPDDEFFVKTDDLRLKQIFINLISNAMKFTSKGSIEIGCNVIDNEKTIHFYVKDTGIGISKDKQEEIFYRFIQADQTTSKLYGGTGLGLAISQGLVSTFKGKLWLESEEGQGSTFNFTIPLILE